MREGWTRRRGARPATPGTVCLLLASLLILGACQSAPAPMPSDAAAVLAHQALNAQDPGRHGPFEVRTLYYGHGEDRHRPEYRDSVALITPTVDASRLVSFGGDAEERRKYWGFGPDSFPLNARVWYPEGEGPFPLVLTVHGNHDMTDFSDPGYAYLGRLLASRGIIMASVDMNFVNGGVRGENDARGWLLLKHLELWREWAREPGNPFEGRVDMEKLALVGHSRGGEAVGHAAAFNRLERYPDDASLTFDFGFHIRGVVAIAPVDGQYEPAGRKVPVRDVSYLVLHGSHDGDVTSFHGLRLWDRLRLTRDGYFKAALYVYRANHGQWNTLWGPHDNGPRSGRILDLDALLPGEEQRRVAEVYLGAFLEATLKGRNEYLPLFLDHRVAGEWLPPTMYVTRFQSSGFRPLATFEEDIDVTSGTAEGVELAGEGLARWREGELMLRSSNWPTTSRSQETHAVWVGWGEGERDGEPGGGPVPEPAYRISLPPGLAGSLGVDPAWALSLSLAPTPCVPSGRGCREAGPDDPPVGVWVEVEDGSGNRARRPLDRYGAVRPPLEANILRRGDLEAERFPQRYDLLLQTYVLPLEDFRDAGSGFEPGELRIVRLVFDGSAPGEVVVDQVGLTRLDPAFLAARVPF